MKNQQKRNKKKIEFDTQIHKHTQSETEVKKGNNTVEIKHILIHLSSYLGTCS